MVDLRSNRLQLMAASRCHMEAHLVLVATAAHSKPLKPNGRSPLLLKALLVDNMGTGTDDVQVKAFFAAHFCVYFISQMSLFEYPSS